MKQILLLACVALLSAGLSAQIVYVDVDATGNDDGTSWTNAYSDLDDALVNAVGGTTIWVAQGTYTTPADRSFVVMDSLNLYGGFIGGETSLEEAEPEKNLTILSGDVMGNDVPGEYSTATYSDNQRVLLIDGADENSRDFTVTIDGFTIQNGGIQGDQLSMISDLGGGILSRARLMASRLKFRDNRGLSGSAVSLFGLDASESSFDDIEVQGNFAAGGRAFYIFGTNAVIFSNSSFSGSGSSDGGGMFYIELSFNFLVENCMFSNINSSSVGGGLLATDVDLFIRNTEFSNCQAVDGPAVYYRTSELHPGDGITNWTLGVFGGSVTDCRAIDTEASLGGGMAVRSFVADAIVDNMPIDGVIDSTSSYTAVFDGVRFENNVCGNLGGNYVPGLGGALFFTNQDIDTSSIVRIRNAEFLNNTATEGGAIELLTTADIIISNTVFTGNRGISGNNSAGQEIQSNGGAVRTDNDRGVTVFDSCTFTANTLEGIENTFGGAVAILLPSSFQSSEDPDQLSIPYIFNNSTFTDNSGQRGGAIFALGSYFLDVRNSRFTSNGIQEEMNGQLPTTRGGAIEGFAGPIEGSTGANVGIRIDSTVFEENVVEGGGGGAITQQAFFEDNASFLATNSTFSLNGAGDDSNGGAIYLIGNNTDVAIEDCQFLTNSATGEGGAIAYSAFNFTPEDSDDFQQTQINSRIERTYFSENFTELQGGAISTQSAVTDLINCVFTNNSAGGGSGGAIIFNGNLAEFDDQNNRIADAGEYELSADLVNNTFYGNTKDEDAVGNQIGIFQPGVNDGDDPNSITLNLLNNAFILPDGIADDQDQIAIEGLDTDGLPGFLSSVGVVELNSLGGNFINTDEGFNVDSDGDEIFSEANGDIVTTELDSEDDFEDIFTDPMGIELDDDITNNFTLVCSDPANPLIDAGATSDLLPDTDIAGDDRNIEGTPDIGAFESDCNMVDTYEPIEESGLAMTFFPNPTADVLTIQNNEPGVTSFNVMLVDQVGRVLKSGVATGVNSRLDLRDLPVGIYNLQLIVDGRMYSKRIVRQ